MVFSRVGKNTINCVISEDEIQDLGFSVEEIVTKSDRTQEFMNQIFDLAEREFQTKFEMGIKTVQVEFRSDRTLSLTFSENPAAEGMMEHLKDIIGNLLNSIPQEKWEEYHRQNRIEQSESEDVEVVILLKFKEMDTVIRFAKQVQVEEFPMSWLCKDKGEYYLMMDLTGYEETEVRRLSTLTDEYASDLDVGEKRWAYLKEHGKMLLRGNAIEQLRLL